MYPLTSFKNIFLTLHLKTIIYGLVDAFICRTVPADGQREKRQGDKQIVLSKPAPHQSLVFQRDHVSIRVEPLQWHYLPVGRNQFLFRARQTQMQFDDGKISSSGNNQILSISQITSLTFERFTNSAFSRFSPVFIRHFFDMLNRCRQQFPTRGKKHLSSKHPNLLQSCSPSEDVHSKMSCVKTSPKEIAENA